VFSLIPTQWGKAFEVTNLRPIVVEALGGGFQSRNSERLQIQRLRGRAANVGSDYQMLSIVGAV
jgi:hypothetical protein